MRIAKMPATYRAAKVRRLVRFLERKERELARQPETARELVLVREILEYVRDEFVIQYEDESDKRIDAAT